MDTYFCFSVISVFLVFGRDTIETLPIRDTFQKAEKTEKAEKQKNHAKLYNIEHAYASNKLI
jgi:hypothetical protein